MASPITDKMQQSKPFTYLIYYFAKPWSEEMAYQVGQRDTGNWGGRLINIIGIPICAVVGLLISIPLQVMVFFMFAWIACIYLLWLYRKQRWTLLIHRS